MANEVQTIHDDAAETVYTIVRNMAGQFYAGATAEAFESANWATYDIAMAEVDAGGAGVNVALQGTFPAVAAGYYWVDFYIQAAGAPASTDVHLKSILFFWDTTTLLPAEAMIGTPVAFDGGAATVAGMLTKLADDNAGADFDATTDSQTAIADKSVVSGTSAVSTTATGTASSTPTVVGTPTATYAATTELNETYHSWAPTGTDMEFAYDTNVGSNGVAVSVSWSGFCQAINDIVTVYARNWSGTSWEQIGTIVGTSGENTQIFEWDLTSAHTDTGANAGNVRIRFLSAATDTIVEFATDRILFNYAVVAQSAGYANGSIWVNSVSGSSGVTPYTDGTVETPVTWAAALTLSASLGITRFSIATGSTVTVTAAGAAALTFLGHGWNFVMDGKAIAGAHITGANVSGIGTGDDAEFADCHFEAATTLDTCECHNCGFESTFTMTAAGVYNLVNCHDHDATTTGNPEFIFAAGAKMATRYWAGGLKVSGMASGDYATLDGNGRLVIANDCAGGSIITLRGNWPPPVTGASQLSAAEFRALDPVGVLTDTQRFGTDQTYNADMIKISTSAAAANNLEAILVGDGITGDVDITMRSLTVTNDTGTAVTFTSSGGAGHGIAINGNDIGHGMYIVGGATGDGISVAGQGTGAGIKVDAGATGIGLDINATAGTAIDATTVAGAGMIIQGTTFGIDVNATGGIGIDIDGTTSGITADGAAGPGIHFGGTTFGIEATASAGPGLSAVASAGTGAGIVAAGYGSGHGISSTGGATGYGIAALGGAIGHGLYCFGGATSGDGIYAAGNTLGDGMTLVAAGASQYDLNADIKGDVTGSVSGSTTHFTDIKGTGFAKDTDSLVNLKHTNAGAGVIVHTITVDDGTDPVADVSVWLTTSSTIGSTPIADGLTDASGEVVFYLTAGTYYSWAKKGGHSFSSNPTTETVA